MFRELPEGDVAVVVSGGVYRQCKLATFNGQLFAAVGAGRYVRLTEKGTTSQANTTLVSLVYDGPLLRDQFGRLCVEPGEGRKALLEDKKTALLAPPT